MTEWEFYQNEEFEYDPEDHQIDFEESHTPSMLLTKQVNGIKQTKVKNMCR